MKAADAKARALEELYRASPAEFMSTRDALARQLKEAGDKEGAAELKAQRKPTQIAFVLNQLARRNADDLAELVDVGRELARAQRKALRGEAGHDLRDAITRQREVVSALTRKTAALMTELGVPTTGHLDEVAAALQAALVDPAVGAELEEGRLVKVPAPAAGFPGAAPQVAPDEEPPRTRAVPPAPPSRTRVTPRDSAKEREAEKRAREKLQREIDARAREQAAREEREREAAKRAREEAAREEQARAKSAKEKARIEQRLAARQAAAAKAHEEATRLAREAAKAESEAAARADEAKQLGTDAKSLADEAKRLAAEAKRVAREAEAAERAAAKAAAEASRAAAASKAARARALRASRRATALDGSA